MIIGVPKEIKRNEARVALTPRGAGDLIRSGHTVYIESGAGRLSGFPDGAYRRMGAEIHSGKDIFASSELILKVKEPLPEEFECFSPGQILFSYLHLAAERELTEMLLGSGITTIAYETVQLDNGILPLLRPMSEVAGSMVGPIAAHYLAASAGGKGSIMGGVPGIEPARVLILGGGTVGASAARIVSGMAARVTLLEKDPERLRELNAILPREIEILFPSPDLIEEKAVRSDVIIGSVLIPGARAPRLLDRGLLGEMEAGSVIIDVSIDQGGCLATSKPTTHDDPVYTVDGVLHYCVTNMPAAYPRSSTQALTNATLPYVKKIARLGWRESMKRDPSLRRGLNTFDGTLFNRAVGEAFDLPVQAAEQALTP